MELMTETQAAQYLGVSALTIRRWRYTSKPRIRYRLVGKRAFYERDDLDRYLAGVVVEPEGDGRHA